MYVAWDQQPACNCNGYHVVVVWKPLKRLSWTLMLGVRKRLSRLRQAATAEAKHGTTKHHQWKLVIHHRPSLAVLLTFVASSGKYCNAFLSARQSRPTPGPSRVRSFLSHSEVAFLILVEWREFAWIFISMLFVNYNPTVALAQPSEQQTQNI